ncbi:MAG: class I adenylate-forming enzyme family protein [Acidimicrobiales bacterium]
MIRAELIRTVPELLAGHHRTRPDAVAFDDPTTTVTYGELDKRTARLGGHLAGMAGTRGARGLILMSNRVEVAESYLALTRAAMVAVCVNAAAAEPEVAYQLDHSGAEIVITDADHLDMVTSLRDSRPNLRCVLVASSMPSGHDWVVDYDRLANTDPDLSAPDDLDLDDTAYLLYTSGTTGRPKGVMLTQRSLLWVVATCWSPILGLGPDDRLLSPLPLFHSYALDLSVLGVVATGASAHLMPRFTTDATLDHLRSGMFTVLAGVPTMFQYLLNAGTEAESLPGLTRCVTAGAVMPGSVNQAFEERFGVTLLDGYGITETSTMVTMNWPNSSRIPGSCGFAVTGVGVRLVDPATGHDVGAGTDGEVWVSGPGVMQGYYDNPEATAAALTDGWYHTGDLARRDANGFLTISGRIKELIIRGGENIYPAEVEAAILLAPGVADAAIVGAPHPQLGEVPVAFVVPEAGATIDPEAIRAAVAGQLTSFKVPAEVYTTDVIPRTGSGKTKRFELVQRLGTDS